jgi:hypothetical protein
MDQIKGRLRRKKRFFETWTGTLSGKKRKFIPVSKISNLAKPGIS